MRLWWAKTLKETLCFPGLNFEVFQMKKINMLPSLEKGVSLSGSRPRMGWRAEGMDARPEKRPLYLMKDF